MNSGAFTLCFRKSIPSEAKIKGLLLAGFCGSPELSAAVEKCITQTPLKGPDEVESAMWAVTQCCRDNLERCLDVILEAFTYLSPERTKDGAMPSERDDALFDLGGKRIASDLPKYAVPVIIDQCQKRPDIADDLSFFLYRIDDPIALTYWVRRKAEKIREDKKAGRNTVGFFAFHDEWRSELRYGRTMSAESRHALWEIWSNANETEEDRETAFHLWKAQTSTVDLLLLRAATVEGKLGESILQTRVSLGDKSAYEPFIEYVKTCPKLQQLFWWQFARGIMDAQLARGVVQCLDKYADSISGDYMYILSELIMELPPELSEPIIVKLWDKLKLNPEFFQAALYVGTEKTRKLAADSFEHIPDKHRMLRYLHMHFGFSIEGRSHRITEEHLKSIEPYLDYLDSKQLSFLWSDCNRHKFFEWRRKYLDNKITEIEDDRLNYDISSREALLDDLCKEGQVWYGWVKHNFLDLGYTIDEALAGISQWAGKRGTKDAIKVAADLFFSAANRSHLHLFDRLVANRPLETALQQQVHFGVKYRTLS